MIISVIGGDEASEHVMKLAEGVGRELARKGVTLCCGGRGGVMEAASRGAREEGGHTIGILPGHDAAETPPNRWVEFPVFTGLGFARNSLVALTGEAVIAIDGSYGTLSEIAFARIHNRPIIGIDTWDFDYHGHDGAAVFRTTDPVEAVTKAIELAEQRRRG